VFAPASFEIDRDRLWLDEQTSIGIYGPTRCIIDAFWLRHQEGSDPNPRVGDELISVSCE